MPLSVPSLFDSLFLAPLVLEQVGGATLHLAHHQHGHRHHQRVHLRHSSPYTDPPYRRPASSTRTSSSCSPLSDPQPPPPSPASLPGRPRQQAHSISHPRPSAPPPRPSPPSPRAPTYSTASLARPPRLTLSLLPPPPLAQMHTQARVQGRHDGRRRRRQVGPHRPLHPPDLCLSVRLFRSLLLLPADYAADAHHNTGTTRRLRTATAATSTSTASRSPSRCSTRPAPSKCVPLLPLPLPPSVPLPSLLQVLLVDHPSARAVHVPLVPLRPLGRRLPPRLQPHVARQRRRAPHHLGADPAHQGDDPRHGRGHGCSRTRRCRRESGSDG